MRRAAVLACFAFLASSCGTPSAPTVNPFPGQAAPARDVELPAAMDLSWRRYLVHLEPTVVLWASQAHVDVPTTVTGALRKIETALDATPARVTVQAGSVWTIPSVGIGGVTNSSTGDVRITMDQRRTVRVKMLLETWLPIAMAHELHHSKRILDGPGYGSTLLDAMITEGSAEAFVREIYPRAPSIPWVRSLEQETERAVWRKAKRVLRAADNPGLYHDWFVGGNGLPRWAGYKIGYAIVSRYLDRHPDVTAADLATMAASRIYEGSRYDGPESKLSAS